MKKITHAMIAHCADGCGAIRAVYGRESATSKFDREQRRDIAEMAAAGIIAASSWTES